MFPSEITCPTLILHCERLGWFLIIEKYGHYRYFSLLIGCWCRSLETFHKSALKPHFGNFCSICFVVVCQKQAKKAQTIVYTAVFLRANSKVRLSAVPRKAIKHILNFARVWKKRKKNCRRWKHQQIHLFYCPSNAREGHAKILSTEMSATCTYNQCREYSYNWYLEKRDDKLVYGQTHEEKYLTLIMTEM